MKWLQGEFVGGDSPTQLPGLGLFETMCAVTGVLPLWERHLQRLQQSATRLSLPFVPPADLRAAAAELLLHNNHEDGALRLALLPDGRLELCSRDRQNAPQLVRLIPTVQRRPDAAPPASLKATPRAFYDAVQHEAQQGAADDGIVLGDDGAVLETATGNLWLHLDGGWVTPPLDGRVLPGIARALLLEHGAGRERACDLADLHRALHLAVSNAVHGPRPAVLVSTRPASVESFDTSLQTLWRQCMVG